MYGESKRGGTVPRRNLKEQLIQKGPDLKRYIHFSVYSPPAVVRRNSNRHSNNINIITLNIQFVIIIWDVCRIFISRISCFLITVIAWVIRVVWMWLFQYFHENGLIFIVNINFDNRIDRFNLDSNKNIF